MAKLTLALAFAASALTFLIDKFVVLGLLPDVRFLDMILMAPAVVLGCSAWFKVRSYSNAAPVVLCVLLMLIGLVWVADTERGRGMLVFARIAMVLPIASLIVSRDAWGFCARTYLVATAIGLACIFLFADVSSFGIATDGTGSQVTDRNEVAQQFGFAAILVLLLHFGRPARARYDRLLTALAFGFFGALAVAIVLTASRGGILTLFITAVVACLGQKRILMSAATAMLAIVLVAVMAATAPTGRSAGPLQRIVSRFENESLYTLGDRTSIWKGGLAALTRTPECLLVGVGTGGADAALGRYVAADAGQDGVVRKSSHNTFVEWVVCHGVVGAILGVWFLVGALRQGLRLDRRDGSRNRRTILVYCLLVSMTCVIYREPSFSAVGSLFLAMLSDRIRFDAVPSQNACTQEPLLAQNPSRDIGTLT